MHTHTHTYTHACPLSLSAKSDLWTEVKVRVQRDQWPQSCSITPSASGPVHLWVFEAGRKACHRGNQIAGWCGTVEIKPGQIVESLLWLRREISAVWTARDQRLETGQGHFCKFRQLILEFLEQSIESVCISGKIWAPRYLIVQLVLTLTHFVTFHTTIGSIHVPNSLL